MAGRNNPRTSGTKRTGGDTAASIIGNLLLFAVPGVGLIRVAMTAKKAIQAIRAIKGAKQVAKPTATQIKNAKPPSALPKPKSGNTTPLTSKPKGDVISGTAREVKPRTSVVPSGGRAVKKPGTGVQPDRVVKMKDKPKGMKMAQRNDKRVTGKTSKRGGSALGPTVAASLIAGMAATTDGDKKPSAGTRKSPVPTPTSKPAKRVDLGTVKARKTTPANDYKAKKREGGPGARPEKATPSKVISAGPNTGFGPKGNIFPGSAAERKELMKKYGGTGSAAAKAAAAGKQGNLASARKKGK